MRFLFIIVRFFIVKRFCVRIMVLLCFMFAFGKAPDDLGKSGFLQ